MLLDNNNRKPIIRLNLNGKSVKFVTTFEQGKDVGVRRDIEVSGRHLQSRRRADPADNQAVRKWRRAERVRSRRAP